jgi:DNA polymerase-3 subunit gamma/tau
MTDAGAPATQPDSAASGGLDLATAAGAGKPYRVLARKYRPASFADLIGQDAVVRTVSNAFETVRTTASWPIRSSKLDGRYLRASTR